MAKVASTPSSRARDKRQVNTHNRNTFAFVLFDILESGRYDCLRWSHDGKRVVITSRSAIVNLVLPGYFETLKFDSFTRQFHIYEFRRTTDNRKAKDPDGYCEFHHPNFKRGRPDLLDKIPRKKTLKGLASGESPPDRNGVLQRIRTLNLKGGSVEPTSMQLDMVSGAPSAMATLAGLPPNVLAAIGHDPALFGVPSSAAYPAADPGGFNTNPHASFMDAFATSLITDPVTEELFKTLQHAANLADQVPVIVQDFLVGLYGRLQESARRCRDAGMRQQRQAAGASTSSDASGGSQSPRSSPVPAPAPAPAPAIFTSFAPPADVLMAAESLTLDPMTAPVIGGAFFSDGLSVREPLSAIPQTTTDTRYLFPPLDAPLGLMQHGQGLALGAQGPSHAPAQFHAPDYSSLTPTCNNFQPPPPGPMSAAVGSAADGPPQSAGLSMLYAPSSAGGHMPQQQQQAMQLSMMEMLPPLPMAQMTAVLHGSGASTGPALMPADLANPHGWGPALPFGAPDGSRARGISSPANIFGQGLPRHP